MVRRSVIMVARLIFAAVFGIAVAFKFAGMPATAAIIAAAGFPFSQILAWVAALFELGLVVAFLTGLYYAQAALLAAAYVLFLALAFHGPSHWAGNQMEMGNFISHFPFIAGLLLAAVVGPGETMVVRAARLDRLDATERPA